MLKNYLKIAIRIFWQHKIYVAINLAGLSFALACCILSYLNYNYRAAFDTNHTHAGNIYRVNALRKIEGASQRWGITPAPLGGALINDVPDVHRMARLYSQTVIVKKDENTINEELHFADKNLFSFFDLPLEAGNYEAFERRNNIVISRSLAIKYFGKEQAIGKQLNLLKEGKSETFTVIGVLKRIPENSSLHFDMVTSFDNAFVSREKDLTDWRHAALITTFVEIKNKQSITALTSMLDRYAAVQNRLREDWKIEGFYLQPFREIALSSDIDFDNYVHNSSLNCNPRGVGMFVPAIMSLFILMIACFNFTNISIAFAGTRLKEIGMRKVMGGRKLQLIKQFLIENILICLVACLLSIVLVKSILPLLNSRSGMELRFNVVETPGLLIFIFLLPVITALVAGLYPSFYISSFEPIGILKGTTRFGPKSPFTRVLLFMQFSISSLSLIIGIALTKNAAYQNNADFGYAINDVAVTAITNKQEFAALNYILRDNADIVSMGGSVQQIGESATSGKVSVDNKEVTAQLAAVGGEGYLRTMGIRLLQGRHFYTGGSDKTNSVIVNNTLIDQLHISQPVGKQIKVDSSYYTIIGVAADYKEFGLHGKVPPCILRQASDDDFRFMVVRANAGRLPEVQKAIKTAWHKIAPDKPYNGFLQSEVIEKEKYMNQGLQSVCLFLAAIIIALSASGLFALASLNILRRSKEVGIRKALGASIPDLMTLVSRDLILIIAAAFAVGSLLAYLIIKKIIFQLIYAYHADLSIDIFISTLGLVMFSCCATMGWKVYTASSLSPVKVLRK
jgi:ABC-type antimicrobial peptide transport system permease subunit